VEPIFPTRTYFPHFSIRKDIRQLKDKLNVDNETNEFLLDCYAVAEPVAAAQLGSNTRFHQGPSHPGQEGVSGKLRCLPWREIVRHSARAQSRWIALRSDMAR